MKAESEFARYYFTLDTKVDIWSFGIFAMELTNGDPPYINEPQSRVIINIVMNQPPPIKAKWSPTF